MRVTFAGHSTVLIELGTDRVLTDPLLRRRVGHLLRHGNAVDPSLWNDLAAVLVSHGHLDHLHLASLRRIAHTVPVVVPSGLGTTVSKVGFTNVTELAADEELVLGGSRVTAVHAEHEVRRLPLGAPSPALGYVVGTAAAPGPRAYFAGDTDIFDGMRDLASPPYGPIDVALIPVWGWGPKLGPGHLDPRAAADAVSLVRPRIAVPIHWGTLLPAGLGRLRRELLVDPPRAFAKFVATLGLDTEVRLLLPGESTDV